MMATKNMEIYKKKKDGSLELVGYLPTEDVPSRVDEAESSINNLNNAVADRYTKGETDSKLDDETVKTNNTKDMTYDEITAMKRSYVGSSTQGPYKTDNGAHENLIRVVNKNFGGVNYVFEMSHDFWENNGIHYRYKAEGDFSPWKTLIDSDTIGSQHVAEADHADTATLANSVNLPRTMDYDIDSLTQANKVGFNEINNGSSIGGLGWHWWHVMTSQGPDTDYATQLAIMMSEGGVPQLAFRNKLAKTWRDWAVAISDKTIGQQTVKSFTATEVDHGCKFNGDLQSTSLVTSPMHVATSEFTVSPDNKPNAERTKQGNLEVTFGSVKKTIHMKYNPFMEYFFKHGYHFSAVKEGGDSTLYDRGIVTYGNFIYYCVYTYRSENDDDFAAAIIATDDTEDMSKYVMSQGGSASELQIVGNYFRTDNLKKVEIQEKAGTLALTTDIPSVPKLVDDLTTADASSTLSANQGYVLNNKIAAIKFSQSGTNSSIGSIGPYNDLGDEDLDYSAQLHGGTYGRFYVISGFETGGHNKNYGKLAIKTSASAKKDMTTSMVAGVSGETGYWSPQWLSVSVIVPAGASYYLYGCRIKDVYFSYVELNH